MWMIFSLLIAALAVVFAVQNNTPSTVRFFAWEFQQSAGVIVLIAFVAGVIASAIFYFPTHLRNRWRIRKHGRHISDLEAKLANERGRRQTLEQELAKGTEIRKEEAPDSPSSGQEP